MSQSTESQEYSARYALKTCLGDIDVIRQTAEAHYRHLVGRELFTSEIKDLHRLIGEVQQWTATPAGVLRKTARDTAAY